MRTALHLSLKAGGKLFINGAVLKADRKVTLELLNDAHFLLSQHFISADEASTPLRQLYFVIQTMLVSPATRSDTMLLYRSSMLALASAFENKDMLVGLLEVSNFIDDGRDYDALRALRRLLPLEDEIFKMKAEPVAPDLVSLGAAKEVAECK